MTKREIRRLSFEEVLALIDEWLARGGGINLGWHLPNDRPWRNVTRRDCLHILKNGYLSWPAEWDTEYENEIYHMCCRDLDDELLEIVFRFDYDNGTIRFITAKPR